MLASALRKSAIFFLLQSAFALCANNVNKVVVHPEEFNQTGYWTESYHEGCEIELHAGYGLNAGLSYAFEGSGVVLRLLHCEACAEVEIAIDEEMPNSIDLSDLNDITEDTFKCPQSIPTFFKTDLEHKKHIIRVTRLNPHLNRPFKVLELEYLTTKNVKDKNGQHASSLSVIGGVLKVVARDVATVALGTIVTYGVQVAMDAAFKGAGLGGVQMQSTSTGESTVDQTIWDSARVVSTVNTAFTGTGGLGGVE